MSPRTTESGVVDALTIAQRFFCSLRTEDLERSEVVFDSAFDSVNALSMCALSHDVRARVAWIIKTASARFGADSKLLQLQRQEAQDKIRELQTALEKERDVKGRDADRKQKHADAFKRALALIVYLLSGAACCFFGGFSFLALVAAAAFDWKLSGDFSIFIALTKFFRKSDK